jgi:hypothetical protein
MNFDELIIEAAKSIAAATAALIKAASEAQRELVRKGQVPQRTHINSEDGEWSEGLVSAARLVAAATHNLCEAADALVKGHASEEKLISAAKQVAGSTARLLVACQVKADPDSVSVRRLEAASKAVRKATDNLVAAASQALEKEEDENVDMNTSAVKSVADVSIAKTFGVLVYCKHIFAFFRKSTRAVKSYAWNTNWKEPVADLKSIIRGGIRQTRKRSSQGTYYVFINLHDLHFACWVIFGLLHEFLLFSGCIGLFS